MSNKFNCKIYFTFFKKYDIQSFRYIQLYLRKYKPEIIFRLKTLDMNNLDDALYLMGLHNMTHMFPLLDDGRIKRTVSNNEIFISDTEQDLISFGAINGNHLNTFKKYKGHGWLYKYHLKGYITECDISKQAITKNSNYDYNTCNLMMLKKYFYMECTGKEYFQPDVRDKLRYFISMGNIPLIKFGLDILIVNMYNLRSENLTIIKTFLERRFISNNKFISTYFGPVVILA